MATMITGECINCGACEPECPNNAISQGEEVYVIDPLLCTECVGFHDHEACAAVCPVDCCVTDPNNVEGEVALISRARAIHPGVQFNENFESRFRKTSGKPGASAPQVQLQRTNDIVTAAETPVGIVVPSKEREPKKLVEKVTNAVPASTLKPESPAPAPKTIKVQKHFPGELAGFQEILDKHDKGSALRRPVIRWLIVLGQPLLGALPDQVQRDLERAVGSHGLSYSTVGATGLNILLNMLLYPLIAMAIALSLYGADVLFSQRINLFVLTGLLVAFAEAVYRLREGIFHAKAVGEMAFAPALYGIPLAYIIRRLLHHRAGVIRGHPIPIDGFYENGFVEKLERERRYGNVYTLEDWGNAYFLRMEFPRKVPDIGLPIRSKLPDEMPDYDYDLILKDGHFIVKGRCIDEKVRSISSSVAAFPPEFTTIVALQDKVHGFSHRYDNKQLEVILLKTATPIKQ